MTILPKAGRKGRAPAWPVGKASPAEMALWNRLWKKPQAVQWEKDGSELAVARYVQLRTSPTEGSTWHRVAETLEDRLGLSSGGLARLRWKIEDDEVAAQRAQPSTRARGGRSSSPTKLAAVPDRWASLRVVDGT